MTWIWTIRKRRTDAENAKRCKCGLRAGIMVMLACASAASALDDKVETGDQPGRFVRTFIDNGVAVKCEITRIEKEISDRPFAVGDNARVSFTVTDAASGEPIRGLHPLAWVDKRRQATAPSADEMRDKIAAFLGGFLSIEADIDLNSYRLWTINHDNTVSVINPLTVFSRTKLESIILLPGLGADLAFTPDQKLIFVTMPDNDAVAVIDTASHRLRKIISTGLGTRPVRLLPQPDGKTMWVGLDDQPRVAALDIESLRIAGTVEVGKGRHNLVWVPGDELLCVANTTASTLTVIDAPHRRRIHNISVGQTPVALDYSPASELVYVASLNGDGVSVVNPLEGIVVSTIAAPPGLVDLGLAPSGRHGFALNQFENVALVFDTATNVIVDRIEVVAGPDQVIFTDGFAYVRGIDSPAISLIKLSSLGVNRAAPAEIIAGKLPASARPEDINIAPMIVPTPEGNEVMIANNPDMGMYYYVEGMLAPMGTFQNYKRRPRGLALLDNSLLENPPGVYAADTILPESGVQDIFFVIDQPRVVKRLEFSVVPSAEEIDRESRAITIKVPEESLRATPGAEADLRFTITNSGSGEPVPGLRNVLVMMTRETGRWHARQFARELGDGSYAIRQKFPDPGIYSLVFWVESHGVTPSTSPVYKVRVYHERSSSAQP